MEHLKQQKLSLQSWRPKMLGLVPSSKSKRLIHILLLASGYSLACLRVTPVFIYIRSLSLSFSLSGRELCFGEDANICLFPPYKSPVTNQSAVPLKAGLFGEPKNLLSLQGMAEGLFVGYRWHPNSCTTRKSHFSVANFSQLCRWNYPLNHLTIP